MLNFMDSLLVLLWVIVFVMIIYLNFNLDYLDKDDKGAMFICLPARAIKRLRNNKEAH